MCILRSCSLPYTNNEWHCKSTPCKYPLETNKVYLQVDLHQPAYTILQSPVVYVPAHQVCMHKKDSWCNASWFFNNAKTASLLSRSIHPGSSNQYLLLRTTMSRAAHQREYLPEYWELLHTCNLSQPEENWGMTWSCTGKMNRPHQWTTHGKLRSGLTVVITSWESVTNYQTITSITNDSD